MKRGEPMKRVGFSKPQPVKEAKLRMRKCATCRTPFPPKSMMHRACSQPCAEQLIAVEKARKDRKERQAGLIALKPAKWFKAKAKTAMHAFVRARDEGKCCASCDTVLVKLGRMGGDYDAGHMRAVGVAKHLEFDARNVWGQCKPCNDHKRGNFQEYERRMRLIHGDEYVDALLADNTPRHLKIPDFQAIEAHYKAALKNLKEASK